MKYFFSTLLLINLSISYCQSNSNSNWTLQQCTDSALVNNYAISSINLKSDISAVKLSNAKYSYLPTLNGAATHGYNWGQTIDPFTNQFATNQVQYNNFYLNSSLVLFSGMQNFYSQKISEIDYQSQSYNKQIEERNLRIQIASAYLQVLLNNEILNISKEHLALTLNQKERVINLVEANREPKNKILEILAQEETDKYNILKSQNDLNYSLLLLQQLMNTTYDSSFNIEKIDTLNSPTVNNGNLSNFPELQLSDLALEKQECELKTSQSRLYPSLSVNASIGSGYSENNKFLTQNGDFRPKPFSSQLDENFYQSASLTLTIPIFNKNVNSTQVQINRIELEQIKLDREKQKLDIQNKIEQLKMDVSNSEGQYKSSLIVQKANESNYLNSQIQYENGVITYSNLLEAKNKLFDAKSNSIQSKYRKIISSFALSIFSN